jgi:hypothetical protein
MLHVMLENNVLEHVENMNIPSYKKVLRYIPYLSAMTYGMYLKHFILPEGLHLIYQLCHA